MSDRLEAFHDSDRILRQAASTFFDHLSEMCEGIMMVDRAGRLVWISDRYERYLTALGFSSPAEVLGRPVEEVVPNTLMREVVETGKPILLDIIENHSGTFVVSRFPLHDDDGEVIGAVGLILYDRIESLKPLMSRLNRLQSELAEARKELAQQRRTRYTFSNFVGNSAPVVAVKSRARRAAALNTTVLLLGETGTGKELLAQAIHSASARAHGPFVAVNVAAVPESLLEAEFFGVAPGAYTGADRRGRDGKLAAADGGTLFLDEIGDMPLPVQAKLLRALQEREVEPLGANRVQSVDVRVIAATSVDLEGHVAQGRFRADLYYRLNVLPIRLPPLRDRREDLGLLCEHLLEEIALEHGTLPKEIDPEALALLAARDWPGNIRELRNALEQACSVWDGLRLTAEALGVYDGLAQRETAAGSEESPVAAGVGGVLRPAAAAGPAAVASAAGRASPAPEDAPVDPVEPVLSLQPTGPGADAEWAGTLPERIARMEREAIREALVATGGNRLQAARMLGIARATLYQKLAEHPDLTVSWT
ncbi:sigma-54 interaction domain-containing protein [Quisquiliibacterium transsilvanicum]|uniref:Transcriptional regulator with PAS, ATPase and Fis domain n=1 Tax=Quisquiliibacterium transsilvanicum TaxID=1549638 RepID=A0A7W8HK46_9BURK|nr:sigma 54-interacting transcriptional regulator [Quisquiliibacterium transsilvanicum]MBB5272625.1 transcriptional regulator with PAS, ATPase and Fis domain [Quisquiliibacterium transsilvanicum]